MRDEDRRSLPKNASCKQLIKIMSEGNDTALVFLKQIHEDFKNNQTQWPLSDSKSEKGEMAFRKLISKLDDCNIRGKQLSIAISYYSAFMFENLLANLMNEYFIDEINIKNPENTAVMSGGLEQALKEKFNIPKESTFMLTYISIWPKAPQPPQPSKGKDR